MLSVGRDRGRTEMSREIRREFVLSIATFDQRPVVRRATTSTGVFGICARPEPPSRGGGSINLSRFGARQTRGGVSVNIKQGGQRKLLRGTVIASQSRNLFRRVDSTRNPFEA